VVGRKPGRACAVVRGGAGQAVPVGWGGRVVAAAGPKTEVGLKFKK
jgi:hypothetical protein